MKELGYLLDSNILIYFLQDLNLLKKLASYKDKEWGISVVTHFEVLNGAEKQNLKLETLAQDIKGFHILSFNENISLNALHLARKHKNLKFKDLIIASTAQTYGLSLITADKDFKKLKDVKVIFLKRHE